MPRCRHGVGRRHFYRHDHRPVRRLRPRRFPFTSGDAGRRGVVSASVFFHFHVVFPTPHAVAHLLAPPHRSRSAKRRPGGRSGGGSKWILYGVSTLRASDAIVTGLVAFNPPSYLETVPLLWVSISIRPSFGARGRRHRGECGRRVGRLVGMEWGNECASSLSTRGRRAWRTPTPLTDPSSSSSAVVRHVFGGLTGVDPVSRLECGGKTLPLPACAGIHPRWCEESLYDHHDHPIRSVSILLRSFFPSFFCFYGGCPFHQ